MFKSDSLPQKFRSKSFHYLVKKEEARRIDLENKNLMKRIVTVSPTISTSNLYNSYERAKS
jgi:hypothetical protein